MGVCVSNELLFGNTIFSKSDEWSGNWCYLTSIWAIRLFSKHCDICKDLRLEIPAIQSRYYKSWIEDLKSKSQVF